tara:strand:+ start:258 stop:872 length:615 start_codon:yes stop_codon:yes gene_type:complete
MNLVVISTWIDLTLDFFTWSRDVDLTMLMIVDPKNPQNASDVDATNHFNDIQLATFCNPIFHGIDYPEAHKMTVPDYVPLSAEDLAYIGNTSDFLGIDPYTATDVSQAPEGVEDCARNQSSPYFPYCVTQETQNILGWNIGYRSPSYVYITPTYFRTYMSYLYNTFRSPVIVTSLDSQSLQKLTRLLLKINCMTVREANTTSAS